MNTVKKWYTISEWIDVETGEILPKNKIKDYYKIKTTKKTEINGNTGNIRYQNECRPIGQHKLF